MCGWTGVFDFGMTVPVEPLLHTEGIGSVSDLTLPDPTFQIPVIGGILGFINIQGTRSQHGR
jgi:hypothetical protein